MVDGDKEIGSASGVSTGGPAGARAPKFVEVECVVLGWGARQMLDVTNVLILSVTTWSGSSTATIPMLNTVEHD